jgi:hypothetical protein
MVLARSITTAEQLLAAGCAEVWVVDPGARTVTVHTPDRSSRLFPADQTLSGGPALGGFQTPVAAIFE